MKFSETRRNFLIFFREIKSGHHYFNDETFIWAFCTLFAVLSSVQRHTQKHKNTKIPFNISQIYSQREREKEMERRKTKTKLSKDIKNRINSPSIRYAFYVLLKSGKRKIYFFELQYIKNAVLCSLNGDNISFYY